MSNDKPTSVEFGDCIFSVEEFDESLEQIREINPVMAEIIETLAYYKYPVGESED